MCMVGEDWQERSVRFILQLGMREETQDVFSFIEMLREIVHFQDELYEGIRCSLMCVTGLFRLISTNMISYIL